MGWPLTVAATALPAAEAGCTGAGGAVFWGACAKTGVQERDNPTIVQLKRCMRCMKTGSSTGYIVWPSRAAARVPSPRDNPAKAAADDSEIEPARRDEK